MLQKIVFFLIFSLFSRDINGFKCYQCDSWSNENCRTAKKSMPMVECNDDPKLPPPFNNNKFLSNDTQLLLNATRLASRFFSQSSCGHMDFQMFGNKVTVRGCVPEGTCSSFEAQTRRNFPFLMLSSCNLCLGHLCNSASKTTSTLLSIVFLSFLLKQFFNKYF